jgi:DNA-directed RNA polymerase specialized sigma24 family protein
MSPQALGTPSDDSAAQLRQASDVELLRAIAGGSEPAFEELRGRYRGAVARVCRVAGSEREDCEQEVFARVWRKAALFDPARGSAAAWLLTLARRTAINQLAARRPPTPVEQDPIAVPAEPAELDAFWLETALQRVGAENSGYESAS